MKQFDKPDRLNILSTVNFNMINISDVVFEDDQVVNMTNPFKMFKHEGV